MCAGIYMVFLFARLMAFRNRKIIKAVKSPKTGAYVFKEEMVPNDAVKEALNK